ncbi:MAG: glycoside hydrolase family 43 protein [Sedimentisphaerales bacterium]|nr:glycoside hydrolase family 43 protein [Sedimentisphaerales bacterium]
MILRGRILAGAVQTVMGLSALVVTAGSQTTLTNPVAPRGQDPWVIRDGGLYYYCYSSRGRIWVNQARTIQEAVQYDGTAVWQPERGQPYSRELWAPELHKLAGQWYIYVAADDGRNENHRMYVLQSQTTDPAGPYQFKGKIADASDKWAIDGTVMQYEERLYFIWSGWEGDENVQQNLYIAAMKDPLSIEGPRSLISKPEYDWEKIGQPLVNEGPEVLVHEDDVFIIYSASGSWTDHYCLGQLRLVGADPLDPNAWEKKKTPVFASTASVFAPGHACFAKSPDGTEDWIIYHAARDQGAGWNRNVRMQRFTWDAEGNPCLGYPVAEGLEIAAPSE